MWLAEFMFYVINTDVLTHTAWNDIITIKVTDKVYVNTLVTYY